MGERKNVSLGNFGFLLDCGEDARFLFELAQQAESCLYTNPRLCAAFIRQLTELFLDLVMDEKGISHDEQFPSIKTYRETLKEHIDRKDRSWEWFFGRVKCPPGKGDGSDNTLNVWTYLAHLGNNGSHGASQERIWLEEQYLKQALQELCERMRLYFSLDGRIRYMDYQNHKTCYGSREILFPCEGKAGTPKKHAGTDGLPARWEQLCDIVAPLVEPGNTISYKKAGCALVRRYERPEDPKALNEIKNYLQQSQRAYLRIQRHGGIAGLPEYSVLADLSSSENKYYVVSYRFYTPPRELDEWSLQDFQCFRDRWTLLRLLRGLVDALSQMCRLEIWHRTFTHRCVRLEHYENDDVVAKVIGLETCKLSNSDPELTTRYQAEEMQGLNMLEDDLVQYGGITLPDNPESDDYRLFVLRRLGAVCLNILCPKHLSGRWEAPATKEEILSLKNERLFAAGPSENEQRSADRISHELAGKLADLFTEMMKGEKDFDDALTALDALAERR